MALNGDLLAFQSKDVDAFASNDDNSDDHADDDGIFFALAFPSLISRCLLIVTDWFQLGFIIGFLGIVVVMGAAGFLDLLFAFFLAF